MRGGRRWRRHSFLHLTFSVLGTFFVFISWRCGPGLSSCTGAHSPALGEWLGVLFQPFFRFPNYEGGESYSEYSSIGKRKRETRTSAVAGGCGRHLLRLRKVDAKDIALEHVQVHVVDRIQGVAGRGVSHECEPAVFGG